MRCDGDRLAWRDGTRLAARPRCPSRGRSTAGRCASGGPGPCARRRPRPEPGGASVHRELLRLSRDGSVSGGRAPSLFDEKWLGTVTDERHVTTRSERRAAAPRWTGFKDKLNDAADLAAHPVHPHAERRPPHAADIRARAARRHHQDRKADRPLEVVAKDLNTPWGIAFLPDGRMLVTERTEGGGQLRVIDKGALQPPVTGTPRVHVQQDAGMFDVEVHPRYAAERLDLSVLRRIAAWLHAARRRRPAPPADAAAPGRGRGRGRPCPR